MRINIGYLLEFNIKCEHNTMICFTVYLYTIFDWENKDDLHFPAFVNDTRNYTGDYILFALSSEIRRGPTYKQHGRVRTRKVLTNNKWSRYIISSQSGCQYKCCIIYRWVHSIVGTRINNRSSILHVFLCKTTPRM